MLKMRKNTVDRSKDNSLIDFTKQNLTGILGVRGAGKSYLGEAILERYYNNGYTCLDLWAAPNLENGFWIFAKEGHKKRIPITILAPESFITPETRIDRFNGNYITKQPLVKFVKLPTPTKKTDSEQNDKILELITSTVIECRDSRRILVFNPFMFPNETEMFRTLEILMRNLLSISQKYFDAVEPKDVGYNTMEEMPMMMRNSHKMCFFFREFGEVVPARLKGDKSGESTLIKKALLKFVRLARHANIDGVIDYQNSSDADSSIRNQIDTWYIKKWTKNLAGENFNNIFQTIDKKRKIIFNKIGYNNKAFMLADNYFPPIEKLSYFWFYVHKEGDPPRLEKVPELHIRHKEPSDKWTKLTEIPIEFDEELLSKTLASPTKKSSNDDEKKLYDTIRELKSRKGKEKLKWNDVIEVLSEMQENGEIVYRLSFNDMTSNTISSIFSRLMTKFKEK